MTESYRALWQALVSAGWCGSAVDGYPRLISDYIPHFGSITARQYADWVLEAEGFPIRTTRESIRAARWIEALFIRHMGDRPVPARAFW